MAVGLLAVSLIGGLYLAGWATLMLLQEVRYALSWNTYLTYWQVVHDPAWRAYAWKIQLGGIAGFGLPLLLCFFLLIGLLRSGASRRDSVLYGSARFATRHDLRKHELLLDEPTGIVVGRHGSTFIKIGKSRHVVVIAGTRAGKGVSVVLPNALEWGQSLVMLDIKFEGHAISAGHRATLGPVHLFNPFAEDGCTARWNPLSYVRLDPRLRDGNINGIAACLYPDAPGQDPFWQNVSRDAFKAIVHYLFDHYLHLKNEQQTSVLAKQTFPTLGKVYRILSGEGAGRGEKKHDYFQRLMAEPYVGAAARAGLRNLCDLPPETFASAVGTTLSPLHIFGNPLVDAATAADDFDLTTIRKTIQTIYVGVAPNRLAEAKGILNLFMEQAIKRNGGEQMGTNKDLKYQCLFLLDEFAALGKVEIIANSLNWIASYGIRYLFVLQSKAQLEAIYGAAVAQAMVANMGVQAVLTPREQRDAEDYSQMIGEVTIRRKQRTRNYGQSGGGYSETEVLEKRRLMTADEVKQLSPKRILIFVEGLGYAILAKKIFYYQDAYFKKRLLPPPPVPKLKLSDDKPQRPAPKLELVA